MGNRAIIKAKGNDNKGVYLHWNGGRDSVQAFLKYCELRGFRGFEDDYGMARFCQVVGNYFGGNGLSIGIADSVSSHGDNGVYVVEGWEIVGREDFEGGEQMNYDLSEMLFSIDKAQPIKQQIGEYIRAKEVETKEVKIGDIVFVRELDNTFKKYEVIGMGEDRVVNGTKVLSLPCVNRFPNGGGLFTENINNYITEESVRVQK